MKLYLEPLAILANKDNPIDDISVEEIKEINTMSEITDKVGEDNKGK